MRLTSYYQRPLESLTALSADGLWQAEAAELMARPAADNADGFLADLLDSQRLHKIKIAGLENDALFKAAAADAMLPRWKDFTSPPVPLTLQQSLAAKLYNIRDDKPDVGLITGGNGARNLVIYLLERCLSEDVPFVVQIPDPTFDALLLNSAAEAGVLALADDLLAMTEPVTRHMLAGGGGQGRRIKLDPQKEQIYARAIRPYQDRRRSNDIFFTLTSIPTEKDAAIDGFPYDDYLKLFFEMCDQPWDWIGPAQELLIEEFNAAETVRITNSDGTDLSMSLVDHDGTHFTFCNSLIAKNVPGSEIFSAPRRDSVNGVVVARGKFSEHGSGLMENLTLEFRDGHLIKAIAETGQAALDHIINLDAGARYVGELGIGTNPHLRRHVVNGLLVEKIGGSFHVALGTSYKFTDYVGTTVKVDNGNDSALHWDITTMLYGRDGLIMLDGRTVMENGFWVDPKYDVLNRGWATVPRDKRPEYWRDRF